MEPFICQYRGYLKPFSEEDERILASELATNQLVKVRITSVSKPTRKIIEQSGLLHACYKLVLENSNNPCHQTFDGVKMSCKVGTHFVDPSMVFVRPDGGVQLQYRSMAFDKLKGNDRQEWMTKFFQWCADQIGLTVEEMVIEAKKRMLRGDPA